MREREPQTAPWTGPLTRPEQAPPPQPPRRLCSPPHTPDAPVSFRPQGSFPGPHPRASRPACALRAGAPAAALGWSVAPGRPSRARAAALHPAQAGGTAYVLACPQQPLWHPVEKDDSPGSSSPPEGLPATRQFSDQTHTARPLGEGLACAATQRDPSTQAEMGFQPECEHVPEGAVQGGAAGCSSPSLFTGGTRPPPHPIPAYHSYLQTRGHTHTNTRAHTHAHTIQTVNVEKINGCAKNRTEPASSPNLRNAK